MSQNPPSPGKPRKPLVMAVYRRYPNDPAGNKLRARQAMSHLLHQVTTSHAAPSPSPESSAPSSPSEA